MNWRRLYATFQNGAVICMVFSMSAGFWSFIVAAWCFKVFGLNEATAMLMIGAPIFLAMIVYAAINVPELMRTAGLIGEKPETFGPWFSHPKHGRNFRKNSCL